MSPLSIINWVNAGRLPAFRTPGGHRRIRRDDLIRFMRENGIPPPPECADQAAVITLDGNPVMTMRLEFEDFVQEALTGSNLVLDFNNTTALQCDWDRGECALGTPKP